MLLDNVCYQTKNSTFLVLLYSHCLLYNFSRFWLLQTTFEVVDTQDPEKDNNR